jgi:hypothetical protein
LADEKQSENQKYFSHFGSMITNNGIFTREVKSKFAMTRAAFKKRRRRRKRKRKRKRRKKKRRN